MADLIAIGRRVVIGNSPLLKSYSAKAPVMYLELAVVPSLYLGRACSDQTPSSMILVIFSFKNSVCFCHDFPLYSIENKVFFETFLK